MNAWQVVRQLVYLIRQRRWEGNPAFELVFQPKSVVETSAAPDLAVSELVMPACLVRPLDAESDLFDPRLLLERFEVTIASAVSGGRHGRESLSGGPRASGAGSSSGRGVLEIEDEVLSTVQKLQQDSGVRLVVRSISAAEPQYLAEKGYVTTRTIVLEGAIVQGRYYHPPLRLAATAPGGGAVTLTWLLPPTRYDTSALALRRAAGATAPASATAGTAVAVGALATTVTDTPGVGQWSYAIFMGYDETGSGVVGRYSSQEVKTTATVTAT